MATTAEGTGSTGLRGSGGLAVAMLVTNVATYGFQVVSARLLGPVEYGAVAGLMAFLLVLSVLQLGTQATAARRQARALQPPLRLRDLHRRLLDAFRSRLAAPGGGWGTLPADEPYVWDQLFRHLSGAEDPTSLAVAADDDAWLVRRLTSLIVS